MLRGALLAGGAVGVITVVLIAAVGSVMPALSLCLIWALGLGAGLGAVWLGKPTTAAEAAQGSALAGALVVGGDYVGAVIGAVILRYVVAPSGFIPLENLPAGINSDPMLYFGRNICLCICAEGFVIMLCSVLSGMALFGLRNRQKNS